MGLKIIVVGAGIAGLTTALALRQLGHSVEVSHLLTIFVLVANAITSILEEPFPGEECY